MCMNDTNIIELHFIDMRYDEGQYTEHNTG